jgi:hypothetical protein
MIGFGESINFSFPINPNAKKALDIFAFQRISFGHCRKTIKDKITYYRIYEFPLL